MQEYLKKILGSDRRQSYPLALPNIAILIKSNDEMKAIIEKGESLEGSAILLKRVSETIQNEAKDQKG